ncbi:PREDICTED: uncharacterized protein LOC104804214 [Tarenaya hassleriana]|uniref:uncharacterized protein LOC104804214 n=1 Tax=Tarenaya hassleriana TaxID=28532 RepID=UPI00053C0C31|nr:PREDICTED: uncharacterized protein LOC104804214 [Tarenaya hassleriana]
MSAHLSKTDSEVSSLPNSSPARGANVVYYVQSPSRDSHDGEKTTNSFHSSSTPPVLSPMGSPPHSSRGSSSTRLSRPHKAKRFDSIEEERLLGSGPDHALTVRSRRFYFLAFVSGFFVLFTVFSLILWAASRPQKPSVTMRSILFDQFVVQAGSDGSGVATSMVSMNCSVRLTFLNRASFFGVHVTSTPLDLSYSQLTVATGSINKFYQSRKSEKSMVVQVRGQKIPIYGGGVELASENRAPVQPVPLTLSFMVRSRAYVLGKLVKPMFYKKIVCYVTMEPRKMSIHIPLKNKCNYE